jgi:hypothetical protein
VGWAIELRKTLIGALNPFSDGEGNTAGCVISRVTAHRSIPGTRVFPLCVGLVLDRPMFSLVHATATLTVGKFDRRQVSVSPFNWPNSAFFGIIAVRSDYCSLTPSCTSRSRISRANFFRAPTIALGHADAVVRHAGTLASHHFLLAQCVHSSFSLESVTPVL